jgi:hypothetical protein
MMNVKITVFCNVMPRSMVDKYQSSVGTNCFYLQCRRHWYLSVKSCCVMSTLTTVKTSNFIFSLINTHCENL